MNNKLIASLVLTASALVSTSASAVPLVAIGDYPLSGTTSADHPELAGFVIEDVLSDFSLSGAGETISGKIQNRVVRSDVDGTLAFYWRILPDTGTGDVLAFRLTDFGGFTLDADWRIDGLGTVAPTTARYLDVANGSVNFLFDLNEVPVAASSNFFYLNTNATHYAMTGLFDLLCAESGCLSPSYQTFAPTAVPAPTTLWLLGSGLAGIVAVAKRRKNKNADQA